MTSNSTGRMPRGTSSGQRGSSPASCGGHLITSSCEVKQKMHTCLEAQYMVQGRKTTPRTGVQGVQSDSWRELGRPPCLGRYGVWGRGPRKHRPESRGSQARSSPGRHFTQSQAAFCRALRSCTPGIRYLGRQVGTEESVLGKAGVT